MRGCPSHHGCTDQPCDVKILLANSEPSTHGPQRTFRDSGGESAFQGKAGIEQPLFIALDLMN
jgi:hypothetical protein